MSEIESDLLEDSLVPPVKGPRTSTVLALLSVAAAIFSYLLAYCLVNALVAADVMTRWSPGRDPRPKAFLAVFVGLMALFVALGAVARWLSRRQLSRIEEMESDE